MPMNTTMVMRHIKRKLGASHFPLPIEDEEIIDIIVEETLPTFSNYFPYFTNIMVDPARHSTGEKGNFFLEIEDTDIEIIGVARVFRQESSIYGYMESQNITQYNTDLTTIQIMSDLSSAIEVPNTFKFYPPNVVELYPKNLGITQPFLVKVKAVHPSHLGTISMGLRDEFLKLALYDVQYSIYQILKHYEGMGTAVGNIALKIEEFEAADANRKELLEKWDTQYLRESNRKKIWIS